MGNPMAIKIFSFAMQKDKFGGLEKGHSFKKPVNKKCNPSGCDSLIFMTSEVHFLRAAQQAHDQGSDWKVTMAEGIISSPQLRELR